MPFPTKPIFQPNNPVYNPLPLAFTLQVDHLARAQHGGEGSLLSGGDGEVVDALDLDPHLGVGAVVRSYQIVSMASIS